MDLGHNKGQKRAKYHGYIDGRPTRAKNGLFWFLGHPVAKFGWIGKKIGRHPQYTIIFDICSVFLKILIFVALTRD